MNETLRIIDEAAPIDPKVFGAVSVLPTKIKLDKDLATRLRKLNDKQVAVQQFVSLISRQGEERIAELASEGRTIWQDVAKRYGIDLDRVQWNLDNDGETIVPVGMRLS